MNETLDLPSLWEIHIGNKNYRSVTSDTKAPIFFVAEVIFYFSQYCMKPYSKITLINK